MKSSRQVVLGGASFLTLASALCGQVTYVAVPVPTIAADQTRVRDINAQGTLALLETPVPLHPPSTRNREYSVVRPDGSQVTRWASVDYNPATSVNDAGTAVWGHSTTMSMMLRATNLTQVENEGVLGWALDVSGDERFVVGYRESGNNYVPLRWDRDAADFATDLGGTPGRPYGAVQNILDNGAYACGYTLPSGGSSSSGYRATVWDSAGAARALALPAGMIGSFATYVDRMGGAAGFALNSDIEARPAQWLPGGGVRLLPINGVRGYVTGMSLDGRIITGYDMAPGVDGSVVWIDGVEHNLHQYLVELGVTGLDGWYLNYDLLVSSDGRHLCGVAVTAAGDCDVYFATIPGVCAADLGKAGGLYGGDGSLDNNDFIAFIGEFFAGNASADVGSAGGQAGGDGSLDNNDFIAFISLYFTGC